VKNSPPKFITKLASLIEINDLEPKVIILPQVKDDENNNWKMNVYDTITFKKPTFIEI
jgi:hypothetical protein